MASASIRALHPGIDSGSSWLLQTNPLGMRDLREFSPTPARGIARIVLFGDSFTVGEGADVKDRYSNLIEASEPGLKVMYLIYRELGRQSNSELLMLSPMHRKSPGCFSGLLRFRARMAGLPSAEALLHLDGRRWHIIELNATTGRR